MTRIFDNIELNLGGHLVETHVAAQLVVEARLVGRLDDVDAGSTGRGHSCGASEHVGRLDRWNQNHPSPTRTA